MSVLFDRIYPRKDSQEPSSLLTDEEIAANIIAGVQSGKVWRVAMLNAMSAATGAQKRPVTRVRKICDQLKAEVSMLQAISLRVYEYETPQDFGAALAEVAHFIPVATWTQFLQDAYDIPDGTIAERFAALKAKLAPGV